MSIGWIQIAVVGLLVILLFGRGKISSLMGELAQGIKSFRKGLEVKDAEIIEKPKAEDTRAEDTRAEDTRAEDKRDL